jgi:hypothetical protein
MRLRTSKCWRKDQDHHRRQEVLKEQNQDLHQPIVISLAYQVSSILLLKIMSVHFREPSGMIRTTYLDSNLTSKTIPFQL